MGARGSPGLLSCEGRLWRSSLLGGQFNLAVAANGGRNVQRSILTMICKAIDARKCRKQKCKLDGKNTESIQKAWLRVKNRGNVFYVA